MNYLDQNMQLTLKFKLTYAKINKLKQHTPPK